MLRPLLSALALLFVLICSAFAADKPAITFDDFFNAVDFTAVEFPPTVAPL